MGLFYMVEIYQPARQNKGDLAVFTATGEERERERETAKGASWEKTIIQNLPELFLEASSLPNSPGVVVHLVTKAFWPCIMEALDGMAFHCNRGRFRRLRWGLLCHFDTLNTPILAPCLSCLKP